MNDTLKKQLDDLQEAIENAQDLFNRIDLSVGDGGYLGGVQGGLIDAETNLNTAIYNLKKNKVL